MLSRRGRGRRRVLTVDDRSDDGAEQGVEDRNGGEGDGEVDQSRSTPMKNLSVTPFVLHSTSLTVHSKVRRAVRAA